MKKARKAGSFGARPCTKLRVRLVQGGVEALPKSFRRPWIIQRILATLPWACFKEIRAYYNEADRLTSTTGEKHVVAHIIPLNHPRVCGLHIGCNLQVITELQNGAKSNRWCPEQMELF